MMKPNALLTTTDINHSLIHRRHAIQLISLIKPQMKRLSYIFFS